VQRYLVAVLSVAVFCLIAAGCAKPPTEEMEAAKTAVRGARDEGAAVYAAAEFEDATKALSDAETRVATKKYDEARALALQAKQKAEQAKASAVGNKAAARVEAEASIAEADTALSAATTAMATAPRGKGTEEDIAQLNLDLEQATALLAGAKQKAGAEDYYVAAADAEKVSAEAQRIVQAVKTAKENLERARKKATEWMYK